MSIKYMNDAWNLPLNSHEKIVLLAIADTVNDEGFGYPSYKKLTAKTGMSRNTLSKHLKILRDIGLIKTASHGEIGKGKKVNTYTISLRCELPISTDLELIDKIKDIRSKYKVTISTTLDPISTDLIHESLSKPSLKENKQKKKPFAIPTEDDVNDYAVNENLTLDGMYDFYQSNGWKVGKNPMKDWKASARNWNRRNNNGTQRNQTVSGNISQLSGAAGRVAGQHDYLKRRIAEADADELGHKVIPENENAIPAPMGKRISN